MSKERAETHVSHAPPNPPCAPPRAGNSCVWMTSDVRMLVGSDFFSGVKERPPDLAPLMCSAFSGCADA